MTTEFIQNYLDKKIIEDENYIVCTFYDLRIRNNLTEIQADRFLELSKIWLENNNYSVYFTGARYKYKGENKIVQDSEYMVAIKESEVNRNV